ncbi:hypothetical protein BCR33DRAFT_849801 [Rhizoclosmatium globosum]|uniref:ditrans,polycis-polyprenyl diphosphate synthase [(2E,6E)-farnesyldiphosphate specific] n=1 Tax=Rhizoclosmatium globosum TaxID=329046 RepID=A0A1Y2CF61_9FUNG|nr:hypothetical protein BCR33DRAFT_849801 [Rhizoclosmatium globosum]|eukprot:ORY45537.1 hypothetical protein BCR33DRAFT_849801 [Rhizoclosmatium globosum]
MDVMACKRRLNNSFNQPSHASLDALVPLLTDCLRTLNLHVASKHPLSHNIVQLRLQRSLNGGVPQGTAELVDEVDEESVDSGFAAGSLSNPDSDVSDDSDSETVCLQYGLLTREGRKGKIVQVARELAERALAVQKEGRGEARVSDSVDVALVDRMLRGSCDIPEPELMYVVTDSTSHNALEMNGYPPWEIRLTEIYHIKGFRALEYQDYVDGLEMYAKCEKRVGK